jgi:hypothetical protein
MVMSSNYHAVDRSVIVGAAVLFHGTHPFS